MIVTLQLRPEELTALHSRADADGVDVETVLHRLVAQIVPLPVSEMREKRELTEQQKAVIALLQARRREDETNDPEELAEHDRNREEVKANLNRWRAEQGQLPAD